jgi:hypothetical protein
VRLIVGDLRADVTNMRKDGSRGRLRIDYGDHRDPQAAVAWLWKFILCRAASYVESACGGPRFACSTSVVSGERLGIITAIPGGRAAGRGAGSSGWCWAGRCGERSFLEGEGGVKVDLG